MLGTSHPVFDQNIVNIVRSIRPSSILDLGCGQGKLGRLIHKSYEASDDAMNNVTLSGVNPLFNKIEDKIMLESIGYNNVFDMTIEQFCEEYIDSRYDLICALDVLEHLPRSKYFDVLDQLLYRCDYFLIVWPTSHPQNGSVNTYDAHRSSIKLREIASNFEIITYLSTGFHQLSCIHGYNLCLCRGHMNIFQNRSLLF